MSMISPQFAPRYAPGGPIFSVRSSLIKPVFFVEMFGVENHMAPMPYRFETRDAAESRAAELNLACQIAPNREPALRDSISGENRDFVLRWQEWRNAQYQNVSDLGRVAFKYRNWVAHRSEIVSASNRRPGCICPPTKTVSERNERFAADATNTAHEAWTSYITQIAALDCALKTSLAAAIGTEALRDFRVACVDCNALMTL